MVTCPGGRIRQNTKEAIKDSRIGKQNVSHKQTWPVLDDQSGEEGESPARRTSLKAQ